MTEQKQILTQPKEVKSIARIKSYISYIEKFPLYSTLIVLDEYEQDENYEECAIIKKALDEYNKTQFKVSKISSPTRLIDYKGEKFQNILKKHNIVVDEKHAQEKATLIKLKLPLTNGL